MSSANAAAGTRARAATRRSEKSKRATTDMGISRVR
jgi:hypothetical protein